VRHFFEDCIRLVGDTASGSLKTHSSTPLSWARVNAVTTVWATTRQNGYVLGRLSGTFHQNQGNDS